MKNKADDLEADAVYLASSLAMAAARTTTAKRAYEDAKHEENVLTEKVRDAIKRLRAMVPAQPEGDGDG